MLTSESKKILAVAIDNKFNFNNHLQKIIKEASTKELIKEPKEIKSLNWIDKNKFKKF